MSDEIKDDEFSEYMKEVRESADLYLELGLSIIPISLTEKKPAISWKEFQSRQPTEEEVDSWFNDGVPCEGGTTKVFGLGIVTGAISNLVVVDCDNQEALEYAVNDGEIFSNVTVKTTRGNHFYFRHPGFPVPNKVGSVSTDWPNLNGLDLRGDGGYVVAPPSLKWSTKENRFVHQYRFETSEDIHDAFLWLPTYKGMALSFSKREAPSCGASRSLYAMYLSIRSFTLILCSFPCKNEE